MSRGLHEARPPCFHHPHGMSERESDVYGTIGPSSARDALVALRNIEHLVRSPRVDHRVVEELLPELLSGLDALDTFFECGGGECPGEQVGALASASVGATRLAILGFSGPKRVNARLALERALRHEVRVLEGCVEVCDLCRRASGGAEHGAHAPRRARPRAPAGARRGAPLRRDPRRPSPVRVRHDGRGLARSGAAPTRAARVAGRGRARRPRPGARREPRGRPAPRRVDGAEGSGAPRGVLGRRPFGRKDGLRSPRRGRALAPIPAPRLGEPRI